MEPQQPPQDEVEYDLPPEQREAMEQQIASERGSLAHFVQDMYAAGLNEEQIQAVAAKSEARIRKQYADAERKRQSDIAERERLIQERQKSDPLTLIDNALQAVYRSTESEDQKQLLYQQHSRLQDGIRQTLQPDSRGDYDFGDSNSEYRAEHYREPGKGRLPIIDVLQSDTHWKTRERLTPSTAVQEALLRNLGVIGEGENLDAFIKKAKTMPLAEHAKRSGHQGPVQEELPDPQNPNWKSRWVTRVETNIPDFELRMRIDGGPPQIKALLRPQALAKVTPPPRGR